MDWSRFLFLFVFLNLTLINGASAYMIKYLGKDYMESCSDSEPCNSIKFLSCIDNTCQCSSAPEPMFYDEERATCVALASHSCLRQLPTDSNDVQSSKYQVACVENAKCSFPEDVCKCDFRYYESSNNTCIRQHDYGSDCNSDENCDQFKFFSCINSKCSCDPAKNHRYDPKENTCMVAIGNTCRTIEFRNIQEEYFKTDECPEHATCTNGRCECNPGYRITNDRTCGRELGDACDSQDNKCSDIQFTCRNKKCACKYPSHQVQVSETECVSLVSGPCTTEREAKSADDPHFIQNCTENAYCQESQAFNYCKCREGFVETNEGTCVKAWGMACEEDSECDNIAQLACIENKCDCPDRLNTFDDKLRRCVGLAGSRCWKDANSTAAVCHSGAFCVKANAQLNWGKCVCGRGFVTTVQKTCSKSN